MWFLQWILKFSFRVRKRRLANLLPMLLLYYRFHTVLLIVNKCALAIEIV